MIPLKNPNLRRCFNFPVTATYAKYASFLNNFCALHLGLFERNHISPLTQRSQRKSFAVNFDFLQRNHILINRVFCKLLPLC